MKRRKKAYACRLVEKVSIDKETAERKILKHSGGEQQRVRIARAYSHIPDIIIADESVGNLDWETAADVLKILTSLAHDERNAVPSSHIPERSHPVRTRSGVPAMENSFEAISEDSIGGPISD